MRILVEYIVPERYFEAVERYDEEGDWPALMEIADLCGHYSLRVAP